LALVACALLILAFAPAQYFGRQQDDVFFLVAARALTLGHYCLLTTPGCPAITLANPGYPLLMAPLAFFTERPGVFQAFSALLLALSPAALWFWLRRRTDEVTALLAAGLFASSPLVLAQSGSVMSEVPYMLALFGLLIAAEDGREGPAGFWAAALLLFRTAGLAVLPALRRKSLLPPVVVAAAWGAWCFTTTGSVAKFSLLPATYAGRSIGTPLVVATSNALWYAQVWGGCFLPPRLADSGLALTLGLFLAAASALGLSRVLRRRRDDPAAWAFICSFALLLVWGWRYERYLITLVPFLAWTLAEGWGRNGQVGLAALLFLQLAGQTLPRLGRPSPWAEPELKATYAWLAAQPRTTLLASVESVRDGYLSGLPNIPLPDVDGAAAMAEILKKRKVAYVLRVDGLEYGLEHDPSSDIRRGVERAQAQLGDTRYFRLVHDEPSEGAKVYAPL
jgi:hypothetical protein